MKTDAECRVLVDELAAELQEAQEAIEFYKQHILSSDCRSRAIESDRDSLREELLKIKEHSIHIRGVGSVYGDEMLINYLDFLAKQQEIIVPQKRKPHLTLVE